MAHHIISRPMLPH